MSDQSVKADAGKPKLSLVPLQIIRDIAVIREYGNNKYPEGGKDNWKLVEPERYRDALFRHLLLYLEDPYGVDEESGLKHLAHVACNVAFLCELEKGKDENVVYVCDRTACEGCDEDVPCKHTTHIEHAINFKEISDGKYSEKWVYL